VIKQATSIPDIEGGLSCEARLRVCIPTFSSFAREVYRAGLMEAQDVLADCADVDMINLHPRRSFSWREPLVARLAYHDPFRWVRTANPGLFPVRLEKEYDVFMAVCPCWRDLFYINAVKGWRDNCKTSICWIDELWICEISKLTHWLPLLDGFDYIFVGIHGTGRALSTAIGRYCHELAGGVDTLRFSPISRQPKRVIDVYGIGRRIDEVHRALLQLSAEEGVFYIYDTLQTGDSAVADHRAHRTMYADIAKRSRLFVVAPGKVDRPEQTGGQVDIGYRYFEGSAAGAVLFGGPPDSELFRALFKWPDDVVKVRPDGMDTRIVARGLLSDPKRLAEISARNVEEALRRHDWVHRWLQMFSIAKLEPTREMCERVSRLNTIADVFRNEGKNNERLAEQKSS